MLGVVNGIWKIVAEFVPFITSSLPGRHSTRRASAAIAARRYQGPESSSQSAGKNVSSRHPESEPMDPGTQRQKRREFVLSSLNVAIEASNLAKELCSITPAKPVFGSLGVILTMIKVGFFLYHPR